MITNKKMQEANSLNQVAEFHKTFKHPIKETPGIPAMERANLRVSLLAEELNELKQAIEDHNFVEVADALCDLQYVLSGAILEFGWQTSFKTLFDEVHRSNMSKACKTEEEAHATIQHYRKTQQCDAYHKEEDALFLVYRANDHKTLKSINYSPADLQAFFNYFNLGSLLICCRVSWLSIGCSFNYSIHSSSCLQELSNKPVIYQPAIPFLR